MATDDKGNYGTPISYATRQEDNEITFTDPFGFVLSVKGINNSEYICISNVVKVTFQKKYRVTLTRWVVNVFLTMDV